ncbi:tellurium resistance protein [Celeribacter ethanolicus]|uniref:SLAC1 family transporter n=1 Tax=Celeribacter ethanolicus TaxID=1758178 RepID=UPI0008341A57|nr:tellurium resistance protein [Celeribacter ethanolicus]TNE69389.1 MAG: tellurium resistance protein [Paracoccaceae bacterium]
MSQTPPRIMPKPFNAPPQGLWRATPPAIFPPIMGLMGLGLAWRNAAKVIPGAPAWIGEMLLGAFSLLYLFALLTYVAKMARRPSVIAEDLRILPGRAGLAAGADTGFLFAAALVPYSTGLAKTVLVLSLIALTVVALLILRSFALGPAEQRRVTPAWHLSFVGYILAPLSAVPLGWIGLSQFIYMTTLPIALAIWLISVLQVLKADVPAPLRPLLAIHIAPLSLFGIVSVLLGYNSAAAGFGLIAITLLVIGILGTPYLIKAGFSALWGAFTFPLAAFANLMFAVASVSPGAFRLIGGLELVAATLIIVYIASKIMQIWMRGKLSKATNAATV